MDRLLWPMFKLVKFIQKVYSLNVYIILHFKLVMNLFFTEQIHAHSSQRLNTFTFQEATWKSFSFFVWHQFCVIISFMEYAVNFPAWVLERRSDLIVLHYNIAGRIWWLALLGLTFVNYCFPLIDDNFVSISKIQSNDSFLRC